MQDEEARRLAAAIVLRAVRDAQKTTNPNRAAGARRWLKEESAALADALDIPPEHVAAWVDRLLSE